MSPRIAIRNLTRQKRRYSLLWAAVTLGFAVVILLSGSTGGMAAGLRRKASIYYAGDLTIIGLHGPEKYYDIGDFERLSELVTRTGLAYPVVPRGNVYSDGSVFFGGRTSRQKRVTGVDFESERGLLGGLDFVEGGIGGSDGNDGILLSKATADAIGARVGDEILVMVPTFEDQRNTGAFVLRGIFKDASLFGSYTAYCDLDGLNSAVMHPTGITDVGIRLKPGVEAKLAAERIRAAMESAGLQVFPVVHRKDVYDGYKKERDWNGVKYAILTLDAHLYEVRDFLAALDAVTYFLLAVFIAIVTVGITNTYRVLVFERTREIGTMRAMGLQRGGVKAIFLYESLGLGIAGSVAGFLAGILALQFVSAIDLSGVPGFQMFLERDRLRWELDPGLVAFEALVVCAAAVLAAWRPAARAAAVEPADALRS